MKNINQEVVELLKRNQKDVKRTGDRLTLDVNNISITVIRYTRRFNVYLFRVNEEEMDTSVVRPSQAIPYVYLASLFNIK